MNFARERSSAALEGPSRISSAPSSGAGGNRELASAPCIPLGPAVHLVSSGSQAAGLDRKRAPVVRAALRP